MYEWDIDHLLGLLYFPFNLFAALFLLPSAIMDLHILFVLCEVIGHPKIKLMGILYFRTSSSGSLESKLCRWVDLATCMFLNTAQGNSSFDLVFEQTKFRNSTRN